MKRRKISRKTDRGFTLVELLIAIAISLIVLAAGVTAFKKAMDVSAIALNRAEMQANARVAINSIARDLGEAGAGGFPYGGLGLPNGAAPFFARDTAGNNYLNNNTYGQGILFAVTPAFNGGPTIDGITTDGITLVYVDQSLLSAACSNWSSTQVTVDPTGTVITVPGTLCPALNDPVTGLSVGDMMIVSNANGSAIGEVTGPFPTSPTEIDFAAGDPLGMNVPGAISGNIAGLANPPPAPPTPPPPAPIFPPTTISRIFMISYFIQQLDANGAPIPLAGAGTVAPNAVDYRLMRMVNGHTPVPVAEHIVNLKFSYDLMSTIGTETSANPSAVVATLPVYRNIRNVYISVTSRSPHTINTPAGGNGYTYSTMFTNVSPRNLSFKNRYN
ncbi:MAG TPA: prepilin-type N-terminal cleavage/methylation domain-containing protein [Candidatus Angelobacter sp.]